MVKNNIDISVIIATFNSSKTLPLVLDALTSQTFPKNKLEVLLVDGGSTDTTLRIAKKYNCRIINNPRTEPVYAKFLGYKSAKGTYAIYLDHDEILENRKSLEIKYSIFTQNKDVKAVIGSGYKSPSKISFINYYINEFGDPFSFFIYNLTKDARFFIEEMKKKYKIVKETDSSIIVDFSDVKILPIIELCAASGMTDIEYMKKEFPKTLTNPEFIPHFFYLLLKKKPKLGVSKNDNLVHYSSDTFSKYLNKIRWRIKNNIYHKKSMGASGFSGRVLYQPVLNRYKQYLFIPYTYSLILPFIDSLILVITRRQLLYFIHLPLCIFTANLILYHRMQKSLGHNERLKSYDETTEIKV